MSAPTFVSLFTGIGGFDLGLEAAGWTCVGQVEVDPFCQKVLERHWPHVRRYGDIRDVTFAPTAGQQLAGRASPASVDLLCGGFPCQDLSVAGRRAGIAGARSGLFFEFVRLARELQPRWLLLENVPGLLSSNRGRDFAIILAALGDAGYGVGWRVLDSRWFGVPQRRRRVFLVGHLGGPCPYEVLFEPEGVRGDLEASGGTGPEVAGSLGASTAGGRGWRIGADEAAAGQRVAQQVTAFDWRKGDDSTPGRRGRGWVARAGDYAGALRESGQDAVAYSLHADALGRTGKATTPSADAEGRVRLRDPGLGISEEASFALTATAPHAIAFNHMKGGGKPGQGYPPVLTEPQPLYYSHDYNQDRIYDPAGVAPAVCAQDSAGARQDLTGTQVRRLTPTECSRLQGFPDSWTCLCGVEPYSTWTCKCADSSRYASLGNAVTVPVIRYLGERLLAAHQEAQP